MHGQLGLDLEAAGEHRERFDEAARERAVTGQNVFEGVAEHRGDEAGQQPVAGDVAGPIGRLIDVGTGGGFPGVPLAVACPRREFTLIDGTQKKIRFVAESVAALDIRNVQAVAARAENFPGKKDFDVVIARAVGSLADVLHNAGKLLAPHGRLLAMKGRAPDDEIKDLPRGWQAEVIRLQVPGLDAERHLVVISRQRRRGSAPAG